MIFFAVRRCIIRIPRDDKGLCCARALVTALAIKDKNHPQLMQIKKGRKIQITLAKTLHENAELQVFQNYFGRRFQLIVLSGLQSPTIIFKGPDLAKGKQIFLHLHEDHFNLLVQPNALYGRGYYCHLHNTLYDDRFSHKCESTCNACFIGNCKSDLESEWIRCGKCNRNFKNQTCFQRHITEKSKGDSMTVCERFVSANIAIG